MMHIWRARREAKALRNFARTELKPSTAIAAVNLNKLPR